MKIHTPPVCFPLPPVPGNGEPMRVAIIPTYPLYYDFPGMTVEEWMAQPNRERWLVSLMADMGHEAELWAIGEKDSFIQCTGEEGGKYRVRIFEANREHKRAKCHYSESLTDYAREFAADLHLLKGVDGGAGIHLLRNYIKKRPAAAHRRPGYGFIIGGGFESPFMKDAGVVFYETEIQKQKIRFPGPKWQFWRKGPAENGMIKFPKFIDTELFRPREEIEKTWDILVVGRLVSRVKNYDAVMELARHFKVGVAGDGPELERLRSQCPAADWVGYVSNSQLPQYYNRARMFFHTSFIDYYPRVIPEALACGVPVAAFEKVIAADVLPPSCGLRVPFDRYIESVRQLLSDSRRLSGMQKNAREHALEHTGKKACKKAVEEMFKRLET